MKIAVVSLHDRNILDYAQYTYSITKRYCDRYEIPFFGYHDVIDRKRHAAWSKVLAIKNHIMDFDWLLWIDADAAIVNHDTSIESVIEESGIVAPESLILMGKDSNGWNSGVFLLKGGEKARDWLDFVYAQTQFIPHKWNEQGAMSYSFGRPQYAGIVKEINRRKINAYPQQTQPDPYQDGDFILHTPGAPTEARIACFKPFYDKLFPEDVP